MDKYLTKYVQDLYAKNYKILKRIKENQINAELYAVLAG